MDAGTEAAIQAGTYTAWDCPNDLYVDLSISVESWAVVLELKGIYNVAPLAAEYGALPGVQWAEPNGVFGDGPTICGTIDGETYHYVFDNASGDCPAGCISHAYTYYTTQIGSAPQLQGTWDNSSSTPAPAWVAQYGGC